MKHLFNSLMLLALAHPPSDCQTTIFLFEFENGSLLPSSGVATFATTGITEVGNTQGATADCVAIPFNSTGAKDYDDWTTGDNYLFQTSTIGYTGTLQFTYCHRVSSAQIGTFDVRVSPTGLDPWTTVVPSYTPSTTYESKSGTIPASFAGLPNLFILIHKLNNSSGTNRTSRIDNALLTGTLILPVELVDFRAKIFPNRINLSWQTASEQENDHFELQRSADGLAFEEIAIVPGAGTSNEPHFYAFADDKPFPGKNYYRLKQVDFDGKYTHSKVVSVNFGSPGGITLSPTVANAALMVSLDKALAADGVWQILDMGGRVLRSGVFPAETLEYLLELAELPEGALLFRLVEGQEMSVGRFWKR